MKEKNTNNKKYILFGILGFLLGFIVTELLGISIGQSIIDLIRN